ncbi:MAG: NAD(P)/FAD-dependent oxidoreductase [Nitrospirae bacterium]|nr:NAD(P)/FAD-dependent oxidoreductase [Nitrospirota bacterium]
MKNYVIIGSSYAGIGAVEAIREHDRFGRITMLSREPWDFTYGRPIVTYWMGGDKAWDQLWYRPKDHFKRLNVDFRSGVTVAGIDTASRKVVLEEGEPVSYDRLLISTGGTPINPPMEGSGLKGIRNLTTLQDAVEIMGWIEKRKVKNVVVLGGGLIGLSAVKGLAPHKAFNMTVVELADRVLVLGLDREAGGIVGDHLKKQGVVLETQTTIERIVGNKKGEVQEVHLKNGKKIPAELVIVAVGVRPNVEFLKGSGIEIDRGILTDRTMQTNVPGVYAAGDCAQAYEIQSGERRVIAVLPVAYNEGRAAGSNMAGFPRTYKGSLGINSFYLLGLNLMTIGLNIADPAKHEVAVRKDGSVFRKLIFEGNRIVGAILLNDLAGGGFITSLVESKKELDPEMKASLIEGDYLRFVAAKQAHGGVAVRSWRGREAVRAL